ncbi:MAG TPA: hypothetical protein VG056_02315 [Pirellulales bacterium]|jgi:hypothetical protein|nr:hypothetical protein [Pirellulales bacterium]
MASSRVFGLVFAFLLGLVLGNTSVGRADSPADNKSDKLKQLLEERVKWAERAYSACTVAYEAGTQTLDQVLATSNELSRAKLAVCKSKEDRIAVRQLHVAAQKQIEGKIKAPSDVNAKGGEYDKLARASLNRVNAEIELELERDGTAAGENR